MKLLLIRHGKTMANEKHLYCGSTDLSLSEQGRQELAGRTVAVPENCRYLSSGMARANETLELLFPGVNYEKNPGFREVDFGIFEMKSYEMLKEDPAYQAWLTGDNMANTPPGGESGNAMTERVVAAFRELADRGENGVLVTHGGVIAALMEHLFPQENKNRYQWQSPNGGGYLLTFEDGTWAYDTV